jgi:hypothetical protein
MLPWHHRCWLGHVAGGRFSSVQHPLSAARRSAPRSAAPAHVPANTATIAQGPTTQGRCLSAIAMLPSTAENLLQPWRSPEGPRLLPTTTARPPWPSDMSRKDRWGRSCLWQDRQRAGTSTQLSPPVHEGAWVFPGNSIARPQSCQTEAPHSAVPTLPLHQSGRSFRDGVATLRHTPPGPSLLCRGEPRGSFLP